MEHHFDLHVQKQRSVRKAHVNPFEEVVGINSVNLVLRFKIDSTIQKPSSYSAPERKENMCRSTRGSIESMSSSFSG